jgi:hypothetical protein
VQLARCKRHVYYRSVKHRTSMRLCVGGSDGLMVALVSQLSGVRSAGAAVFRCSNAAVLKSDLVGTSSRLRTTGVYLVTRVAGLSDIVGWYSIL